MVNFKPTLLILAAGMGSRYGTLKQMDAFGPNGETIIDYSLYDALNAGFGKFVFIIRESFREEFEKVFRKKLEGKAEVHFVCQELNVLPDAFPFEPERDKPYGTGHAIWVAKDVINEPFGVINADDYYGVESFKQLADFLIKAKNSNSINYSVVAYYLRNTLSDHGTVNRGVCDVSVEGHLNSVKECIKISRDKDGIIKYPEKESFEVLDEDTLVSMNMWGFLPSYFEYCEKNMVKYLTENKGNMTAEFFIPILIDTLIKEKILNVEVIDTESDWFGVTYQEDKPIVIKKINDLISEGIYPCDLWS